MIKNWIQNRKNINSFKNEHMKELNEQNLLNSNFNLNDFKKKLIEKYQIDSSKVETISKKNRIKSATQAIKNAIDGDILTEEEINVIDKSLNNLDLTYEALPKQLNGELNDNILYHVIEHSPLNNLAQDNVNITLPKTEQCYIQQKILVGLNKEVLQERLIIVE